MLVFKPTQKKIILSELLSEYKLIKKKESRLSRMQRDDLETTVEYMLRRKELVKIGKKIIPN